MDFAGKIVIVTGASSGIGAACAVAFAKLGAHLTLVGRDAQRLETTSSKCKEFKNVETLVVRVDLTRECSCREVVNRTIEKFHKIDVLVNSAGNATITSLFEEDCTDVYDAVMELNARVPYKLTHLALPELMKTKGNVVNIIGVSMERIRPGFLPYAMAKAALERFTKSAALELASVGVRVNAVRPGITRTNFLDNFNVEEENRQKVYDRIAQSLPLKRIIEPEEIANMVTFVASDRCPNMIGSNINVDGAASMT
ncbi:3-oxoacyl-[acyl-carrier-protein] reductase FabG [Eumeta japonica]|uniref:3-oxoacyl-[acyl-carrier-protein] reductase FabG n=1 Tax=Eumeta variegata TaxID=151549 RepID=A0A4C1Y056_EUMVA|nr:3-oxoacyl-[acyl-carrier-protein] reductase FabG [Eumeta japonica]